MHQAAALVGLFVFLGVSYAPLPGQSGSDVPAITAEDTYFTIHNLRRARKLTRGEGARVGILDHSFGMASHPELYAGDQDFLAGSSTEDPGSRTHTGYWMALTLKEIAPEAQIFALKTHHPDERTRVKAMVRALDWAIREGLDAVTYCSSALPEEARKELDPAVTRAIQAGVVVVFVNYSHALNLLPRGIGHGSGMDQREPDSSLS